MFKETQNTGKGTMARLAWWVEGWLYRRSQMGRVLAERKVRVETI